MKYRSIILLIAISVIANSCNKNGEGVDPKNSVDGISMGSSSYEATVLNDYAALQLELITGTPGYKGPVAARSIAYLGIAAYESLIPGMANYSSLVGKIKGWNAVPSPNKGVEYHWGAVANAAQHFLMTKIYGTTGDGFKNKIEDLKKKYEQEFQEDVGSDAMERSIRFGVEIGETVWAYAQKDGGHEAYDRNYPRPNTDFKGTGTWQPTGNQSRPLLPNWGTVRSFLQSNASLDLATAEAFSFKNTSSFFEQANAVYQASKSISATDLELVTFWETTEEGYTQAGHQLALISYLVGKGEYTLDKAAVLYLKAGLAMHDAYVVSWRNKYKRNTMRPQTYILQAIDPSYVSPLRAGAYPDFTSEQTTLVSAIASILAAEFGDAYVFEDKTSAFKPKRAYKTFSDYLKEAAQAQIYGGLSYPMSVQSGALQGKQVADNVLRLDLGVAD